jgi:formiminoglutamase
MISIHSYFSPVCSNLYSDKDQWEATQIGRSVDTHLEGAFPDLKFTEIVFFNVSEFEGTKNFASTSDCKIRAAFYDLHFENLPRISDLGSLLLMSDRRESFKIFQLVCEKLLNDGIIPFIIGGGHDLSYAVYKAYSKLERFITLTSVDSKFDIGLKNDNLDSLSHLGKIISHKPNFLFHYSNLAYQSYYVSSNAVEMLQEMNFDTIRLGELKDNFNEIEPIMRNTDFLSFDISAIRHADAGANFYSSPNGLDGEDSCKIMRYAGVSDKLSAVGMFEYNQNLDNSNQTALLLSQMFWYFIDGYKVRKNELNPNIRDCAKYTVAFEDGKNEITFFKSKISGRWWMGVPFKKEGVKELQNYYVACSYRDYELSNQGEVPDRWIKASDKYF